MTNAIHKCSCIGAFWCCRMSYLKTWRLRNYVSYSRLANQRIVPTWNQPLLDNLQSLLRHYSGVKEWARDQCGWFAEGTHWRGNGTGLILLGFLESQTELFVLPRRGDFGMAIGTGSNFSNITIDILDPHIWEMHWALDWIYGHSAFDDGTR